jgi:hypothetical protein
MNRNILLASVVLLLTLLMSAPVYAFSSEAKIGESYLVSTIVGEAQTRSSGELITVPAVLELRCIITEITSKVVLFKIVDGVIRINGTAYTVVGGWYRGIYIKGIGRSLVEGTAIDGEGNRINFILTGKDTSHAAGGTFMNIVGGFKVSGYEYWKLKIKAWRYKFE